MNALKISGQRQFFNFTLAKKQLAAREPNDLAVNCNGLQAPLVGNTQHCSQYGAENYSQTDHLLCHRGEVLS